MTRFILGFVMLCLFSSLTAVAQPDGYEVLVDPNHPEKKMLRGTIQKTLLANDTAFAWYAMNHKSYAPSADLVQTVASSVEKNVYFIVFGGTWCSDTQFILPRMLKLFEQANVPDDRIVLIAVDRQKKTIGPLAQAMQATNVPTVIVMQQGKELGRVVEYGKIGQWDKELAEIVKLVP
jgi:thiol-disulfide isomerase/thioredoxin